jgi:hypothetical protein
MDDDLTFRHSAVDRPGAVTCPQCAATVSLPATEPWMMVDGVAHAPQVESFLCPRCRARIYLHPVTEEERATDAQRDALEDEDP